MITRFCFAVHCHQPVGNFPWVLEEAYTKAYQPFVEILERVWWRLDRALDEESVYLSGLVGAIEAALSGTTLLVDHHASPSFIRGSLGTLRRALEEVGLYTVKNDKIIREQFFYEGDH